MNTVGGVLKLAIEAITGFNESVTFFQWLRSLLSRLNESDVRNLQTSLEDIVCDMGDLINRAEWNSHEKRVAELLPELKAAFYDAEDLLEDFRYYEHELKVQIEGSAASSEPSTKSFRDDIQGDLEKFNCTKKKLDELSSRLKEIGLHPTLRFDRSVRPETTSFSNVPKIFGRDDEIKKLIGLLVVPSRPKRKRSAIHSSASVPVLPIVGIGGLGKTTLAQNICRNPQVKKHFDVTVWICVSNDFDVKRFTKEAIEHLSRKAPTTDNLNCLQVDLEDRLNKGRFLIVLDDIWTENGELWNKFYEPFKHVLQGSMMLVTTRSQKVADIVRTTDPFLLEGLKDDFLRDFFKLCAFASDNSNNYPELERIGEQILPKLKGSPLAAKTLGQLLGRNLDPEHWNNILNSQLWELKQEETDILPALRLSYMYLPFHLKRCFSFCAVYPEDHEFEKEDLAEIWVAEGFVDPENNIPLQQIACKHFEELEYLSFFQKYYRGKFVMHDLIRDMAQLVSKDECFIIKEKRDLERIPPNVRHLSVLGSGDFKCSDLGSLCKQTKLRTLLFHKSLKSKDGNTMVKKWCNELLCMRVMVCESISKWGLPDSITNMKNLWYLKIKDSCLFKHIPAALCRLYNLQLLSASKCSFKEIPRGFSKLINLRKFESQGLKIDAAMEHGEGIKLLTDFNLITRDLSICNPSEISQDQAAKIKLMKEEYISDLTLKWSEGISPKHNAVEVFEALRPPANIKSVRLECYPGESLPSWSHGSQDPTIFSSLTEITVIDCPRLSSLEHFLQPEYIPAIKQMVIKDCPSLEFVPVERFGDLPSLERLDVRNCPKINSQRLLGPSLKGLVLEKSGNLGDNIDCRFLAAFDLSESHLASVTFNMPQLTKLTIKDCIELETLNGGWPVLKSLCIKSCPRLKWENGIMLPSSLEVLRLEDCGITHLASIPGRMWSSDLESLKKIVIAKCQDLVSIGGPEAIACIKDVIIEDCPKLKEIQQPLMR